MSEFVVDVPAGSIFNNEDAQTKCPIACASHSGKWNGQWTTVVEGEMSVCGCVQTVPANQQGKEFVVDVPAGPIFNNEDAQTKCPIVCASQSGKWNGQWKTVVEGEMSVCGCVLTAPAN
jgi:uncharacterized Zn-binding protein involved in type VI secretion